MARNYNMTKRMDKAYANYKKRYKQKQQQLAKKGYNMVTRMLKKREYIANRQAYINEGVKTNINQTIVSEQAYEYDKATALRFKRTAKKFNLDWQDYKVEELMKAKQDISELNNKLKQMTDEEREELFKILPESVKHTNQGYISYMVFGSD